LVKGLALVRPSERSERFEPVVMHYGKSKPPLGGQQRLRRDSVILQPFRKPYFCKARIANSEQEGSKRHDWRTLLGATSR